ncbi:hypothetical protein ZIOFF_012814 [Zingiber officinale]|uniref:Uncharacterized protein n=1 Tax=Zingiber officinale TaxID=94328 RepID=A0A8J5HSW9_ZINOF|nr:hypothetical protein ZIOFF_012814 [Zingiber officinale]
MSADRTSSPSNKVRDDLMDGRTSSRLVDRVVRSGKLGQTKSRLCERPVRRADRLSEKLAGKEGQDTQDELQKRDFREELEERERRHFSSKDKSYTGTRREAKDRIVPRNIDADDSDVDVNDDEDSDR